MIAIAYTWWVFIHLLGVFGFLLSHGVSVAVMLRVRKERDRERIRTLLQLSGSTVLAMYVSLAVLLIGGMGGAFQQKYWQFTWIKASFALLVLETVLMIGMARPYYMKVKEATALRPSGAPRISDEELAAKLGSPVPVIAAVSGVVALLAILYMMVFKPL